MKLFKRPIGGSSLVLVALSLVILFLAFLGISYLLEKPPVVKNLKVTNVSDGMATITYLTEEPTLGYVTVSNTDSFNLLSQLSSYKYYDDREDSVARYTHHITVRGLQSDSLYYFRISSGLKNVDIAYPSIETGSTPDSLRTPDPAYGQFISSEFNSPDLKAYADALVFMSLNNGTEQSALVNAQGGFTLDKTNVLVKDLSGKVTYKEGDEYTVTLVTNTKSSVVTANVGNDQPIRINELKSTSSSDKLINPLDSNLVKTVSACEVGRSYNECCSAGFSKSVTVTSCTNGNDSGWRVGGCNQSDRACDVSSTPAPAPAPQESKADASNLNEEQERQKNKTPSCGNYKFGNGDFCYQGNSYNCAGNTAGTGTITDHQKKCGEGTSTASTNTGTGTNTPANTSTFQRCKDRGYGLWCDGTDLLSCDGKGGGSVQNACGTLGCKDMGDNTPDRCNTAQDNQVKEDGTCPVTANCNASIPAGAAGSFQCQIENSPKNINCCPGGSDYVAEDGACLTQEDLANKKKYRLCTEGTICSSNVVLEGSTKCFGRASGVLNCCAPGDIKNGNKCEPQKTPICPDTDLFDSALVDSTQCYNSSNDQQYYCKPPKVYDPEKKSCVDRLNNAVGVLTPCPLGKALTLSHLTGYSTSCSQTGKTFYYCNEPYVLNEAGNECVEDVSSLADCGGSAVTKAISSANSTACKKNGKKEYKCNAGWAWGVSSCELLNNYPRITSVDKMLNNNPLGIVDAQSVLGTSTDGDTTVKVDDSGVYKINSVDGYTVTTTEVKVTKKTDGTAEIKFFNDTNGNGFKDDGEEFITTPLEVKLEKQKDLASYDLVNGWNLIGWTMADSTVKTAMELLNKIANDGGYATQISTS